jgi:hypothetical protein
LTSSIEEAVIFEVFVDAIKALLFDKYLKTFMALF